MTGYTRQSAATIVTSSPITAAIFNAEFNQLQSAFGVAGHTHDGTAGNGPKVDLTTSVTGVLPNANGGMGTGLIALEAFNTNGIIVQTANDTFAGRTLTAPAAGFTITNPAGTAGNPTFVLANDLAALEGLAANGIVTRTNTDTMTVRTITGTAAEITVTNGDGVAGAPTLSLPAALTFTGKTITGGTYASVTSITTATIISTGLADFSGASAGQIKFPATQNASANANTLDDYAEGTWTPDLKFGGNSTGLSYTSRSGTYTKIGRAVFIQGTFQISGKGVSTGNVTIQGLPFAPNVIQPCTIGSYATFSGLTGGLYGYVDPGSFIVLSQSGSTGTTQITDAVMNGSSNIYFSAVYYV